MFTEWLRKVTRGFTSSIAAFLARFGISANALTIAGCLLNIALGVVIATGRLRLAGFCLIIAAGIDGLDGALARQIGRPTKFGAFLDSVLDRLSESAVLLGLAWWYMSQPGRLEEILAYVTLVGSTMVSYTRARAEGIGVDCEVGLFTRVERCLILIAALILGVTSQALWLLAIGTMLTTIQRILFVYLRVRDQAL
jgi:CDP-diacylglycerol--glycerol-3-phosphate 3-phosphatidyltransferase